MWGKFKWIYKCMSPSVRILDFINLDSISIFNSSNKLIQVYNITPNQKSKIIKKKNQLEEWVTIEIKQDVYEKLKDAMKENNYNNLTLFINDKFSKIYDVYKCKPSSK